MGKAASKMIDMLVLIAGHWAACQARLAPKSASDGLYNRLVNGRSYGIWSCTPKNALSHASRLFQYRIVRHGGQATYPSIGYIPSPSRLSQLIPVPGNIRDKCKHTFRKVRRIE